MMKLMYVHSLDVSKRPLTLVVACLLMTACATTSQTAPVLEPSLKVATAPPPPAPQLVQVVTQVQALREELKQVRNSIEQQQFEVENLNQRQVDLFKGLDQRLQTMESARSAMSGSYGGVTSTYANSENAVKAVGGDITVPSSGISTNGTANQINGINTVIPEFDQPLASTVVPTETQTNTGSVTLDQQSLYDQGFDFLKQSRYTDAIGSFDKLLNQFPNSPLADDAMYWVGEANYVNRQYEAAISSFRNVVTRYPGSDRVPEALLKVGYVHYEVGDYDKAKQTFSDVISRYANHPVAVSAKSRLQRIDRGLSN